VKHPQKNDYFLWIMWITLFITYIYGLPYVDNYIMFHGQIVITN